MSSFGNGDLGWFQAARFGMFIHWGIYAMPARHEWVQHQEAITPEKYRVYFDLFNPDLFQPQQWAKAAKMAGMKYFVITAKHHDGFCLFDSKYTDYKATNTPIGRDLLREVVEAFREEGLRVGLYYSLLDWHHEDFIIDQRFGPFRELPEEERKKMNAARSMSRYAKYMRDQVTELLTNYGKIDILWFDFSYPAPADPTNGELGKGREQWESEKLIELLRQLQPEIIVSNRLDLPDSGDIITPEQYTPDKELTDKNGLPQAWEGCQTFSGSWGYHRDESSWKSAEQCIKMLIDHVSRNGNLLMNVGPTARGFLDIRAMERLNDYGEWMKYHQRSIYSCGAARDFTAPLDCRYTYNAAKGILYLHLYSWPFKSLQLPGLAGRVKYMQLLYDGSEISWRIESGHNMAEATAKGAISIYLPVAKPPVVVPVIEIFLNPVNEKSEE